VDRIPQPLVATIVHNAGIFNAILAGDRVGGLGGDPARDVAHDLLVSAAIAWIFGAATLRSWPTVTTTWIDRVDGAVML